MSAYMYYACQPPERWRAGYTVMDGMRAPFFFNCARCGAEGPPIAGMLAKSVAKPAFADVAIVGDLKHGNLRPALFCEKCYPLELAEAQSRLVSDAAEATEYFSEDELERHADRQRKAT